MAKKKRQAKYRKLVGFVYITISAVLIYTLGMNVYRVVTQQGRLTELQAEKDELETYKKKLAKEVDLLNDDDYATRYARENYGFSKDGEQIIKLPETKK